MEYEERNTEWQAIRPLLVAAPALFESCVWVQSKLFEIMGQHEAGSPQWKALQTLAFHHQSAIAKAKGDAPAVRLTCTARAQWAEHAVIAYAHAKEGRAYDPIEEMASDLFADLCHLFVREGVSPEQMIERARLHYEEECSEEGIIL
jgi:hypothetical protein